MLAIEDDKKLKPLGPYFVGQIVDYSGKPATNARRYSLSTSRWHIVHCRPQWEQAVREALDDDGMAGYTPMEPYMRRVRFNLHRRVMKPMFTGYTFAGFDVTAKDWCRIRDIKGVTRLFMIDGVPVPVSERIMQRVRDVEVQLSEHGVKAAPILIKVASVVRILEGAFIGFFATVLELDERKRTCKVELDIFGRLTPLVLGVEQVELV